MTYLELSKLHFANLMHWKCSRMQLQW